MNPKKKAKELISTASKSFSKLGWSMKLVTENLMIEYCKQSALNTVDEILTFVPYGDIKETICEYDNQELHSEYWNEVKQAINEI